MFGQSTERDQFRYVRPLPPLFLEDRSSSHISLVKRTKPKNSPSCCAMGAAASAAGDAYKVDGKPMEIGDLHLPSAAAVADLLRATMKRKGGVDHVRTFVNHVEMVLGKCKAILKTSERASVKKRVRSKMCVECSCLFFYLCLVSLSTTTAREQLSVASDAAKQEEAETLSKQADAVRNAYALKRYV